MDLDMDELLPLIEPLKQVIGAKTYQLRMQNEQLNRQLSIVTQHRQKIIQFWRLLSNDYLAIYNQLSAATSILSGSIPSKSNHLFQPLSVDDEGPIDIKPKLVSRPLNHTTSVSTAAAASSASNIRISDLSPPNPMMGLSIIESKETQTPNQSNNDCWNGNNKNDTRLPLTIAVQPQPPPIPPKKFDEKMLIQQTMRLPNAHSMSSDQASDHSSNSDIDIITVKPLPQLEADTATQSYGQMWTDKQLRKLRKYFHRYGKDWIKIAKRMGKYRPTVSAFECDRKWNDLHKITIQIPNLNPIKSENGSGDRSDRQLQRKKDWKCDVCNKAYSSPYNLKTHQFSHSGDYPYKCLQCSKGFVYKSSLDSHLRTHSGERPFKCHICGKRFAQNGQLTTHYRVHDGTKPFKCYFEGCNKSFTLNGNLTRHIQHAHKSVKKDSSDKDSSSDNSTSTSTSTSTSSSSSSSSSSNSSTVSKK